MSTLQDRRFRRLLVGSALSSFGDSALYLTLGIWAKDLTGSNAAAGAIFLAQGLPTLAAPITGHFIDRMRRKPLLIAVNATAGLAVLSLLAVGSASDLWLLYVFSAFYGAAITIQVPARAGLLKDFVAERDLAVANAAFATVGQGVRIASPLVGAALYAQLGGGSVAVLDAATFAIAVVILNSIRIQESAAAQLERLPVRDRLLVGFRYVRGTAILRQMLKAAITAMLVLGFYESLSFAAIAALGRPPSFFGVLMSVQGLGSILGGLLTARLARKLGEPRTLGLALALWVMASVVYTVPLMPFVLGAVFVFGIAVPLYAVSLGTATQRFAPARMQGRVGSAVGMSTNLTQTLSIAIGAALVDVVSYRILLLVVAVVASVAAIGPLVHPKEAPRSADDRLPLDHTSHAAH